ncbi:MAG: ATP synthase F1 subunit delta [Desulfobacterales bacterium]|nr:ATP synthase F1 subunit delta [Desulfobacterales bacterium]
MKNLSISRRYAKALLLIAIEDGKIEAYSEELALVADLLNTQQNLSSVISNPLYDKQERKKVLRIVIERLNLCQTMQSFLMLLFEKKRIQLISSINDFFQKFSDETKGVARATVISATELSNETVEKIRLSLKQKTGKDIILQIEQDETLIGGLITQIGDLVLDGSVKTQLYKMREFFRRGEII